MNDSPTPQPPPSFQRDENGLVKGVTYPRLPNGRINWKALINPAHIVFNSKNEKVAKEIEQTYGAPAKSLVYAEVAAKQTVDDKHILVLLRGWQELAELRGFTRSVPLSISAAPGMVAAAWEIEWIPNSEDSHGKTTGATADATMENTSGWGYLGAVAGNRAFVRAVRQGLGITILAYDEIEEKDSPPVEGGKESNDSLLGSTQILPVPMLRRACEEAKIGFDKIREGAVGKYRDKIESDPATWKEFEDIPPRDCLTLISLVKARQKKAA